MTILCTDPARSNSGNMFAGCYEHAERRGRADDTTAPKVLAEGEAVLRADVKYLQQGSGDLFNQFPQQGVGSYPIIVDTRRSSWSPASITRKYSDLLKGRSRSYPRPTVWSSHRPSR